MKLARLAFVLLAVVGASAFCADKALAALDGSWTVTSLDQSGVKLPAEQVNAMLLTLTMKDGKYSTKLGTNVLDKGTYKAGADGTGLDIESSQEDLKGRTIKAIYKLDGDTLTVCYDLSGAARPTEYATKAGTQLLVETYKRAGK